MPAHEKWYHLMAHVLLSQPIMFSSSFLLPQGHRVSSSDSSDSMGINRSHKAAFIMYPTKGGGGGAEDFRGGSQIFRAKKGGI